MLLILTRLLGIGESWEAKSRASRRWALRPRIEGLEDRMVLSLSFASFDTGTWAYNAQTENWRKITSAIPNAMAEGADGTLFASYSTGTWRYRYDQDSWQRLTTAVAIGVWQRFATNWAIVFTNSSQ